MEKSSATSNSRPSTSPGWQIALYWLVVGIPLAWGIWKTVIKLPALFQ